MENKTVASCEPNRVAQPSSIQTIPTGLSRVSGYHTSPTTEDYGREPMVIGIMDTGVNFHPDLNLANRVSFIGDLNDNYDNGTHVAGIAAVKDNSFGVVEIAPDARIWSIKVYDTVDNPGNTTTFLLAINYTIAHAKEIKVINLSMDLGQSSHALVAATKQAVDKGITFVAAGNGPRDVAESWPANDPSVITVAAMSDSDGKCGTLGPPVNVQADGYISRRRMIASLAIIVFLVPK